MLYLYVNIATQIQVDSFMEARDTKVLSRPSNCFEKSQIVERTKENKTKTATKKGGRNAIRNKRNLGRRESQKKFGKYSNIVH